MNGNNCCCRKIRHESKKLEQSELKMNNQIKDVQQIMNECKTCRRLHADMSYALFQSSQQAKHKFILIHKLPTVR
jgi:hypothetical protein